MAMDRGVRGAVAVGFLASLTVTLGCSATTAHPVTTHEWRSQTFESIEISIPASWHVYRNTLCTPDEHPGALQLGDATGSGSCTDQIGPPGTVVQLGRLDAGELRVLPTPVASGVLHLHGLTIQSNSYATGMTVWQISSADVQVVGRGPSARAVMSTVRRS
jgi:hypothetical protein